jgi:hypothetical protein
MKAAPVGASLDLLDVRRDALLLPQRERGVAEAVAADLRDEAHLRAGARRRHGLVRALAAGADREARARDRLADARQAARAEGQVGDVDAEDRDAAPRRKRSRGHHAASGASTPFLNRKQP